MVMIISIWHGRATVVDVKKGLWKELKGLDKSLPRFLCGATMTDIGGKLVVVCECQRN